MHGAVVLGREFQEPASGTSMASLAELRITDLAPRHGESFRLRGSGQELDVELVEVKRLGESGREGGAFSLLFRSAKGPFLPQAVYPIEHPALGTMDLFIVPIGPIAGGNGYEVIFT